MCLSYHSMIASSDPSDAICGRKLKREKLAGALREGVMAYSLLCQYSDTSQS